MDNILDGMSLDIEQTDRDKLQSVFPECFVEGKLDIDKLLTMCGEYITNDFEKYKFEWKGKSECLQLAQRRSTGTLRPKPDESVDFDGTNNLYIKGDNLEVLKLLQTSYYRQVKMIYIDPPYNTGNDFVYEDDFADPLARYREITSQTTKSNPESMGRYHTNWLNMIYPRLRLAANLLRDDGVCFISIDDNEVHNLRKVCDEVFGEENFIAEIVWERAFAPVNLKKHFSNSHDYILCYAKRVEELICYGLPRGKGTDKSYKNLDNDPRGVWTSSDMTVGPVISEKLYEITLPSGRKITPTSGRCWLFTKDKYEEMVGDNRIWFGENGDNTPRVKKFLTEVKQGITPMTIWKYSDVEHSQEAAQNLKKLFDGYDYFDYPKPVKLVKRMLELYSNPNSGDIILDFFSGSATTAHAVMQLNAEDGGNRKFIMVQLPELCDEKSEAFNAGYKTICDIGIERIRRAGRKVVSDQWLVVSKDKELLRKYGCKELSRVDCMAERDGNSQIDLFSGQEAAERGAVFSVGSNETGGGFDSVQHSGGTGATFDKGISSIFGSGEGFEGGTGNTASALREGGIPCRYGYFGSDSVVAGSGQNAGCAYKNTNHCPLITTHSPDIGFKVFELDTSNLKTWDGTPVLPEDAQQIFDRMNEMLDRVKSDRSDLDMIYEVMLKMGVPLTYSVNELDVQGKKAYGIGDDNMLIICLAESLTPEIIEELCEYAPAKLILGKNCLEDATAMANAHYICQDRNIEIKLV